MNWTLAMIILGCLTRQEVQLLLQGNSRTLPSRRKRGNGFPLPWPSRWLLSACRQWIQFLEGWSSAIHVCSSLSQTFVLSFSASKHPLRLPLPGHGCELHSEESVTDLPHFLLSDDNFSWFLPLPLWWWTSQSESLNGSIQRGNVDV